MPNTIECEDKTGKIKIVYFNSREGYLRKLYPLNQYIIVSGKIIYFRNSFQITNPDYVSKLIDKDYVLKKYQNTNSQME